MNNDRLVISVDSSRWNFGCIFYIKRIKDDEYKSLEVLPTTNRREIIIDDSYVMLQKDKVVKIADIKTFEDYYNKIFKFAINSRQTDRCKFLLSLFYDTYKNGKTISINGHSTKVKCKFNV